MCDSKIFPVCPRHLVQMNKIGIDPVMGYKRWECSYYGCSNSIVQTSRSRIYNLRMWVHGIFDIIWREASRQPSLAKSGKLREIAYDWLGDELGLVECHISDLNENMCFKAWEAVKNVDALEIYPTIEKKHRNAIHDEIYLRVINAQRCGALYMPLDCFLDEEKMQMA